MTILVYISRRLKLRRPKKLIPIQVQQVGYTAGYTTYFVRRKLGPVLKKRVYQYQFIGLRALTSFVVKGRTPTNSATEFLSSVASVKLKASGNISSPIISVPISATLSIKPTIGTLNPLLDGNGNQLYDGNGNPIVVVGGPSLTLLNLANLSSNLITKVASRILTPNVKASLSSILSSKLKSSLTQLPSGLALVAKGFIKASGSALFAPTNPISIGPISILLYGPRRLNPKFFRPKHILSKNNPPANISLTATSTIVTKSSLSPLVSVATAIVVGGISIISYVSRRRGGRPLRRRYPFQFEQVGYTAHHAVHFARRRMASTRKKKIYPSPKLIGLLATSSSRVKARGSYAALPLVLKASAFTNVAASASITNIHNIISVLGTGISQVKFRSSITGPLSIPRSLLKTQSEASAQINTALAINSVVKTAVQSFAQDTVKASLKAAAAAKVMARNVITNTGATVALLAFGSAIAKAKAVSSGTLKISSRATSQLKPQLVVTNITTLIAVLAAGASQVKASAVFAGMVGITTRTATLAKSQSPIVLTRFFTATVSSVSKLTTRFVGSVRISGATLFASNSPNPFTATAFIVGKSIAQATSNVVGPAATAGLSVIVSAMTVVNQAAMSVFNFPAPLTATATFMGIVSLGNKALSVLTGIPVKGEGGDDNVTGSGP